MIWSNRTLQELMNSNDPEAQKLYEEYQKRIKETPSQQTDDESKIQEFYTKERKDIKEEIDTPNELYNENKKDQPFEKLENVDDLYNKLKERHEKLGPYEVKIGGMALPITPSKIPIQNPTEPKKYKNVAGREVILGVTILPKIVSLNSFFPYFTKGEKTSTSPKEYCDYFEKLKNKGIAVDFKIGKFGTSFKAYITQFDYDLIPGRDVDFTMTLTEDIEVKIDEIDI